MYVLSYIIYTNTLPKTSNYLYLNLNKATIYPNVFPLLHKNYIENV